MSIGNFRKDVPFKKGMILEGMTSKAKNVKVQLTSKIKTDLAR